MRSEEHTSSSTDCLVLKVREVCTVRRLYDPIPRGEDVCRQRSLRTSHPSTMLLDPVQLFFLLASDCLGSLEFLRRPATTWYGSNSYSFRFFRIQTV